MNKARIPRLLDTLQKHGPMKRSDAVAIVNSDETICRLVRAGVLVSFVDDNPNYGEGRSGQRIRCAFVRIGDIQKYSARNTPKTAIDRAIALLERNGYRVTSRM